MNAPQHPALSDRNAFCTLVSDAHRLKVPGSWSGSAYGNHPRGVYREGLLFTDHHHIHDCGCIRAAEVPTAKLRLGCQDSRAHGNPMPSSSESGFVAVWSDGAWVMRGPWEDRASRILFDLAREVAEAKAMADAAKLAEKEAQQQAQANKLAHLRAQYGGDAA